MGIITGSSVEQRNHVNRLGDGTQPMLFAHGYGCDQNMWRFITPAFRKDYQIVLFDHVGSGNSDQSAYDFEKYSSLGAYADDLNQICDELGLKRVILVAHSVSSMIGVLAASKRPGLYEKLILIGPSPCYINKDDYFGGFTPGDIDELIETLESNYLGWSSFITPVIIGNPEMPEYSEELRNSFCAMNPEIAKHFAKVTFLSDNRKDLSSVFTPSLVVQCHPDVIAPVEVGKYVCSQMPDSRYVQLDAPGHCPHLTAPEQVISCIKDFLNN
jgi:sigma-B regulation protein RsbQ